jgi:hypothetical protein
MIVKDIVTQKVYYPDKLAISPFKPDGLETIIKKVPKSDYIVGVGYSEGDHQICISGRRKNTETIHDTIVREMSEELSIIPSAAPSIAIRNDNNYFSIVKLENTTMCKDTPDNDGEDSLERAVICVHGSQELVLGYLKNVNLKTDNEDFITHIWADSAENILGYI